MVSHQSSYQPLSPPPPRYRRQTLAVFRSPPPDSHLVNLAATDRAAPGSRPNSALSRKWVHRSVGDLSAADGSSRQNPRLLSNFYQELLEKYPHAFQHKLEEREATRRVFNARPQVRFQDEPTYEGRKHLSSNLTTDRHYTLPSHLTNWDREVGHYFKSRSNMRDCMTSAESSEIGGPSRARQMPGSQTLNRLLNEQSPLRRKFQVETDGTRSELDFQEYYLERSKARSKHRRKHCRILQRKIDSRETDVNNDDVNDDKENPVNSTKNRHSYENWNGHLRVQNGNKSKSLSDLNQARTSTYSDQTGSVYHNSEGGRKVDVGSVVAETDLKIDTLMEKMSLKMSSPDSLPDSAIDIDTPSAGSFESSSRGGNPELRVMTSAVELPNIPDLPNMKESDPNSNCASKYTENVSSVRQNVENQVVKPKENVYLDTASGEYVRSSSSLNKFSNSKQSEYANEENLRDFDEGGLDTGPGLLQIYQENMAASYTDHNHERLESSKNEVESATNDTGNVDEAFIAADRDVETDLVSESSTSLSSGVQSVQSCVERPGYRGNNCLGDDGHHIEVHVQSTRKYHHRDSDVDSGIGQSSSSGTDTVPRGRSRGRTPNISQMKSNGSVLPLRSDVDVCILDEVDLMGAVHQLSQRRDSLNEEDDTADARLEIAKPSAEEMKIAEKYRRTRSPSPFILTSSRKPGPRRPNSAPYLTTSAGHDFQIVDISISDKPDKVNNNKTNTHVSKSNVNQDSVNKDVSSCQRTGKQIAKHPREAIIKQDSLEERFGSQREEEEEEPIGEELLKFIPAKTHPKCSVSSHSSSGAASSSSNPDNFDNFVNIAADLPREFEDDDDDDHHHEAMTDMFGETGASGEARETFDDHAHDFALKAAGSADVEKQQRIAVDQTGAEIAEPKVSGHERRYKPGVTSPRVNEKRQKMRNKMKNKSDSSMQGETKAAQKRYAQQRLEEESDHNSSSPYSRAYEIEIQQRLAQDRDNHRLSPESVTDGTYVPSVTDSNDNLNGQIGTDGHNGAYVTAANSPQRFRNIHSDTHLENHTRKKGSHEERSKHFVEPSHEDTSDDDDDDDNDSDRVEINAEVYPVKTHETNSTKDRLKETVPTLHQKSALKENTRQNKHSTDQLRQSLNETNQQKGPVQTINDVNAKSVNGENQSKTAPVKPARTKRKNTLPGDLNLSNYKIKPTEGHSQSPEVITPSEGRPQSAVVLGDGGADMHERNRSQSAREYNEAAIDVIEEIEPIAAGDKRLRRRLPVSPENNQEQADAQPQKGNLEKTKKLSASKVSLLDKMGNLKTATKGKFKKLRKAVSLERGIDKCNNNNSSSNSADPNPEPLARGPEMKGHGGKMKKAPSLKSLTSLLGRMKKKKGKWNAEEVEHESAPVPSTSGTLNSAMRHQWASSQGLSQAQAPALQHSGPSPTPGASTVATATRPVGQLLEVLSDGTQLIQLFKPAAGPIGFFIAKGTDKFQNGIFVSRISETRTDGCFSGLLGVGDEILQVNGHFVRDLSQDAVYKLISASPVVVLKVLPLVARRDL